MSLSALVNALLVIPAFYHPLREHCVTALLSRNFNMDELSDCALLVRRFSRALGNPRSLTLAKAAESVTSRHRQVGELQRHLLLITPGNLQNMWRQSRAPTLQDLGAVAFADETWLFFRAAVETPITPENNILHLLHASSMRDILPAVAQYCDMFNPQFLVFPDSHTRRVEAMCRHSDPRLTLDRVWEAVQVDLYSISSEQLMHKIFGNFVSESEFQQLIDCIKQVERIPIIIYATHRKFLTDNPQVHACEELLRDFQHDFGQGNFEGALQAAENLVTRLQRLLEDDERRDSVVRQLGNDFIHAHADDPMILSPDWETAAILTYLDDTEFLIWNFLMERREELDATTFLLALQLCIVGKHLPLIQQTAERIAQDKIQLLTNFHGSLGESVVVKAAMHGTVREELVDALCCRNLDAIDKAVYSALRMFLELKPLNTPGFLSPDYKGPFVKPIKKW